RKPDQAMAGEPVLQLQRAADRHAVLSEALDLLARVPAQREIELVGLLSQLRRPVQRGPIEGAHPRAHLQRTPEVLEGRGACPKLRCLGARSVGALALLILA